MAMNFSKFILAIPIILAFANAEAKDLASRAETEAFIVGRIFHEYSKSLKADMNATFTVAGLWVQKLAASGQQVGISEYSIRNDGRFCGHAAGQCWIVRTEGRNFRLVSGSGRVGKLFTRVK